MKECGSGRVIKVKKKDKQMYYMRLNFVETLSDGMKRYSTKDLPTGLEATKRNWLKANAMLDEAITSSSSNYNRMIYHDYPVFPCKYAVFQIWLFLSSCRFLCFFMALFTKCLPNK